VTLNTWIKKFQRKGIAVSADPSSPENWSGEDKLAVVIETAALTEYFTFYNGERPHQSLSNQTPVQIYRSGRGGGARIVD